MKRKVRKGIKITFVIIIAIIIGILLGNKIPSKNTKVLTNDNNKQEEIKEVDNTLYYECLNKPFSEEELTTELLEEIDDINKMIEYRI